MKNKRLARSSTDNRIFGVCGGLGEYFNIDPTFIRLAFVLLFFARGVGFLTYLAFAIVLPYDYQVRHQSKRQMAQFDETRSQSVKDVTPQDEDDWSDF